MFFMKIPVFFVFPFFSFFRYAHAPPSAADVIDGTGGPRAAPMGYPAGRRSVGAAALGGPPAAMMKAAIY